jgi:SAM-dependent methyltransferase
VGGDALLGALAHADWIALLPLPVLTAGWFLVRFVRSQFLLRRAGIRVPIRPALSVYLAALPGTATPAYLGEAIRSLLLRRRFGAPVRLTLLALLVERLHDVAALALLALVFAGPGQRWVGLVFLAVVIVAWLVIDQLIHRTALALPGAALLRSITAVMPSLTLSIGAWVLAGLLYGMAARALDLALPMGQGIGVLARSTLLGAVTLLPAGFGATGSAAILELESSFSLTNAIALVTLVRLMGTGLAMGVGAVFLAREFRGPTGPAEGVAHFDEIAAEYAGQWSPHVWDLLINRKIGMLADALGAPATAGIGVDLGCGLGLQTMEMRRRGYRVVGLEPAVELLRHRREPGSPVVAGDGLRLPFPDGSLDFVYAIGVLHHLPGREAQATARLEIARVLRPGGLLLVHESNPRNPLFRFYMTYAFPILKRIDEGTEWWLDPRTWTQAAGMTLVGTRYFTFLPDFIPRFLMRPAMAVERWLERGPTAPYSAHYLAVLRRDDGP